MLRLRMGRIAPNCSTAGCKFRPRSDVHQKDRRSQEGAVTCWLRSSFRRAPLLEDRIMRRRLPVATCTAVVVVASLAASATPARAWDRPDEEDTCVLSVPGALLYPRQASRCDYCGYPPSYPHHVRAGRAFRVDGYRDGYLRVHHLQAGGRIESRCVRSVPEAFCRAAGISGWRAGWAERSETQQTCWHRTNLRNVGSAPRLSPWLARPIRRARGR